MLVFASCKKENAFDCLKSNGSRDTEIRYPGQFTTVKVFDKIDVDIIQGPEYKIEVSAYSHIIKNIYTTVNNGVLEVGNHNTCNFVRGYKKIIKITVTMPHVTNVESWGVGTIRFLNCFVEDSIRVVAESSGDIHVNCNCGSLFTHSNGNGDIYLNGSGKRLLVFMNGTNFLYGDNFLLTDKVSIQTLSMGDCFLNADSVKQFNYEIYRSGNIYYKGSPLTINNTSPQIAKGKLLKD